MRRLHALLLASTLASTLCLAGCQDIFINGSMVQGHMLRGPAIFGGIRMDIAILGDNRVGPGSKVMACIDFLFSPVFDILFLPFSIPNEIIEGGIDVRPPVHWDDPQPKRTPYAAPPERKVTEMPGETILGDDAGI